MTRFRVDGHFTIDEKIFLAKVYKGTKSLSETAKIAKCLAKDKGDNYPISRHAIRTWIKFTYPDIYSAITKEREVDLAGRKARKEALKPTEDQHSQDEYLDSLRR